MYNVSMSKLDEWNWFKREDTFVEKSLDTPADIFNQEY